MIKRGRPPKTEERILFLDYIGRGLNITEAAKAVGVCRDTGNRWMRDLSDFQRRTIQASLSVVGIKTHRRMVERLDKDEEIPATLVNAYGKTHPNIERQEIDMNLTHSEKPQIATAEELFGPKGEKDDAETGDS